MSMHKNLHCLTRIFCALILISSAIPSHAQADGEPVVIGKKIQIHSRVLSETRFLFIAKPAGYDEEPERYPVLYLLDGDEDNFVQVTGIVQFLAASERIPPLLVVGVANTDRTHDLTPSTEVETEIRFHPKNGGANMFLQFVSNELIPYVDQHYRTRPYKILIGHSLGGLFAVYSLASNPALFNAYIVIDPPLSWNNQAVLAKAQSTLEKWKELNSDFYITNTGESGVAMAAVQRLCATFDEKPIPGFRWTFKQMPEETHISIVHQSIYSGLDTIFDGWHLANPLKLYDEGGLEAVRRHFSEGAKRYGYSRKAPAFTISLVVAGLMAQDRLEEAAAVLLHDPKSYPAPWNQLDALARFYAQRNDVPHEIKYYTLSLQANPNNVLARKKLGELGVDLERQFPQDKNK